MRHRLGIPGAPRGPVRGPFRQAPAVELHRAKAQTDHLFDKAQIRRDIVQHRRAGIRQDSVRRSAPELIEGLSCDLAHQIPQRDIDDSQGLRRKGKDPRPQASPYLLPRQRVLADECGDHVPQGLAGVAIVIVGGVVRYAAHPFVAVIRRDPHHRIRHVLFRQVVRPRKTLNFRRHDKNLNAFDLHQNRPLAAIDVLRCRRGFRRLQAGSRITIARE